MATIGDIAVRVTAITSPLTSGLSKAGASVRGFGSGITAVASRMAPLAAGVAAVGAAFKGVTDVAKQMGEIDRIAKAARSVGTTAEHMVGLEHAAELSGVGVTQLADAMKRATRQGLSIESVADQIANLKSPVERAALAYKSFGKSGQDLLPLLMSGSTAIRDMVAEGQRLAGFSLVDAAKVEEANDAITRMKLSFTGVARVAAVELAPAVNVVARGVTALGGVIRSMADATRPVIQQLGNVFLSWGQFIFDGWSGIFRDLFSAVGGTVTSIRDLAVKALVGVEFGFTKAGDLIYLAFQKIQLAGVGLFNDLVFGLTEQVPAALGWFAENWRNIFTDIYSATGTIIYNLGRNIMSAMTEIWDFIFSAGANKLEFAWTPLLEGFQRTTEKLVLPERQLSALEKQLQSSIADTSLELSTSFDSLMESRLAQLTGPLSTMPEESTGPAVVELSEASKEALKGPAATQRGSSESFSAIFAAMRGVDKTPMAEVAKQSAKQTSIQQKLLDETRRQSRQEAPTLAVANI